jgi:hypothetical protein
LVGALKKTALLPNIRDNAINSLMALKEGNKSFHKCTITLNDFERHFKYSMNDDIMCNRFIHGMANATLKTLAMSHRAKSVTPLTIVEQRNFLNSLVVDSPLWGELSIPKTILLTMELDVGIGNVPRTIVVEIATVMEERNIARTTMWVNLRTKLRAGVEDVGKARQNTQRTSNN